MPKVRMVLVVNSEEGVRDADQWAQEWLVDAEISSHVLVSAELVSAELLPAQCKRCKEYAVQTNDYRKGECVACGTRHHVGNHANCPTCELMDFSDETSSVHFAMRVDR